jgi:hypothetical protein
MFSAAAVCNGWSERKCMPQTVPRVHRTAARSTRTGISFGEMISREGKVGVDGQRHAFVSIRQPSSERSRSRPSPLVIESFERETLDSEPSWTCGRCVSLRELNHRASCRICSPAGGGA